jgi:signal peptidase II
MKNNTQFFILYGFLVSIIVALDRVTKFFIRIVDKKLYINDFLTLTLQYNRGISWGMLHSENSTMFMAITIVIAFFIALFCIYTTMRFINNYFIIGEIMVCAGAVSNLIDRMWYGGVADFILVLLGSWDFPIFNGADIFIVIGLAIMVITGFLTHEE